MIIKFSWDWMHWMIGASLGNPYSKLISIGPFSIWLHLDSKYKRHQEEAMLKQMEERLNE